MIRTATGDECKATIITLFIVVGLSVIVASLLDGK